MIINIVVFYLSCHSVLVASAENDTDTTDTTIPTDSAAPTDSATPTDTSTPTSAPINDYGFYSPRFSNAYGQQQDPQSYNGIYSSYNPGQPSYSTNAYLRDNWFGNGFNQGIGGAGGLSSYGGGYNSFAGASPPFYGYYSRSGYNGYGGFPNSFSGSHHTGYSGYGGSYGPPPLPGFNGYSGDGNPFGTFEPLGSSFGPRFFPPPPRARQIYPLEPEEEFERAHEPLPMPTMFRPVGTIAQQLTPTNYGYSYVGYIRRQAKLYPIMIYTLASCSACHAAKHMMTASYADIRSHFLELAGNDEWQRQMQVDLQKISGSMMFPYVFICGTYIGGFPELVNLHTTGQLRHMLTMCSSQRSVIRT